MTSFKLLFIENFRLLNAFSDELFTKAQIQIDESSFDVANYKAFRFCLYFLFRRLTGENKITRFRDCWPVYERKDEAKFKEAVLNWLNDLKCAENSGSFPDFSSTLFVTPRGDRVYKFLCGFSTYVLRKILENQNISLLETPSVGNKIDKDSYKSETVRCASKIQEANVVKETYETKAVSMKIFLDEKLKTTEINLDKSQAQCRISADVLSATLAKSGSLLNGWEKDNYAILISSAENFIEKYRSSIVQFERLYERSLILNDQISLALDPHRPKFKPPLKLINDENFLDVLDASNSLNLSKLIRRLIERLNELRRDRTSISNSKLNEFCNFIQMQTKELCVAMKELEETEKYLTSVLIPDLRRSVDEMEKEMKLTSACKPKTIDLELFSLSKRLNLLTEEKDLSHDNSNLNDESRSTNLTVDDQFSFADSFLHSENGSFLVSNDV